MVYVGSEVLTAVVLKTSILWDITQCSPDLTFNGLHCIISQKIELFKYKRHSLAGRYSNLGPQEMRSTVLFFVSLTLRQFLESDEVI
jgi:hypothetical protein